MMRKEISFHDIIRKFSQLEKLSARKFYKHGFVPYLFWTSETYSFGKIYRQILDWPTLVQLPFTSDHGLNLRNELSKYDLISKTQFHLTWNKEISEKYRYTNKKFILIQHPWVYYFNKLKKINLNKRNGTIVFLPKTIPGMENSYRDLIKYIEEVLNLPEKFHPIYFCIAFHDINKGLHIKLKNEKKVNLVTIGHPNRINFVDNFYQLVTNFKFAVCNLIGSEVPLLINLGIPVSVIGQPITRYNFDKANEQLNLGQLNRFVNQYHESIHQSFEGVNTVITNQQKLISEKLLGIENKKLEEYNLKSNLIKELFSIYKSKFF